MLFNVSAERLLVSVAKTGFTVFASVDGSELSSFTASENGLISISAYQYVLEEVGTKKIAFVNQGNVTKTVAVK